MEPDRLIKGKNGRNSAERNQMLLRPRKSHDELAHQFDPNSSFFATAWKLINQPYINRSSLNSKPDHFCWNMLSHTGLQTGLHTQTAGTRGGYTWVNSHCYPVVTLWLCNQMQPVIVKALKLYDLRLSKKWLFEYYLSHKKENKCIDR